MTENEPTLVHVVICKYWNLTEKIITSNSYNINIHESNKIMCTFVYTFNVRYQIFQKNNLLIK